MGCSQEFYENMHSKDGGWSSSGSVQFGYSSSNCPNPGLCTWVTGNSKIEKSETVSTNGVTSVEVEFDVVVKSDRMCEVWLRWTGGSWQKKWGTASDGKYMDRIIKMDGGAGKNKVYIKFVSAGSDSNDRCYFDNVKFDGCNNPTPKPTPKPTNKPTPKPTKKPTNKPTPKPTPKPTKKPTNKPTPKPTPKPTTKPPTTKP